MKTHERTFETMKIAFYITLLILIGLALTSCNRDEPLPTMVVGDLHQNEFMIQRYANCFAKYHRIGPVFVFFFQEERKSLLYGTIACQAMPDDWKIDCWGPYIRQELPNQGPVTYAYLGALASHEVCHLTGIWNEDEADECANKAIERSGCTK